MGNRASIKLKNDTSNNRGIYLHWNGGAESVAAFLEEVKRRMGGYNLKLADANASDHDRENNITTFYAIFYGVAREFFGYCGDHKEVAPLSIYMMSSDPTTMTEDNKCYIIEDDFSCERFNPKSFKGEQLKMYEGIATFFNEMHASSCVVTDDESYLKMEREYDICQLEDEIKYAVEVAKNAALRVERLKQLKEKFLEDEGMQLQA